MSHILPVGFFPEKEDSHDGEQIFNVWIVLNPASNEIALVQVFCGRVLSCTFSLEEYDPKSKLHFNACKVIAKESRDRADRFPDPLDHPDWPEDERLRREDFEPRKEQ